MEEGIVYFVFLSIKYPGSVSSSSFFLSILCILIKTADVLIEAQLLLYFIMQGNLIPHPDVLHHRLLSCFVLYFIACHSDYSGTLGNEV